MKIEVLRVGGWGKHFENNRTRELKKLDWVPVPNKHDGDGFSELLEHANGMAHYGAWMLMVQVASKCDMRGTLLRDGAKPYDARSLARVTRGSQRVFEEAIPRLLEIGWLECISVDVQEDTKNPARGCDNPALGCLEGKGMEGNGTYSTHTPTRASEANRSNGPGSAEANPPAWEEVWAYAQVIGLAEWKARDWLDEMCASGWRDYQHRPVCDWRALLRRVRTKWEADGRPSGPPASQANGKPDHREERRAREYPQDQQIKAKRL